MDTPIATNSLTLGRLLKRHTRYRPSHTAVVIGNERLSYLRFNDFVNRWANALATLGVGRGDRIATILPNSLELLATYWACAKLGAATVPLSPLLLAAGFAVHLVVLLVRPPPDPVAEAGRLFGGLLLVGATVYPWYLLWVLPWAALGRHRAWLGASALLPLTYLPGLFEVPLFPLVFLAVWLPFGALFVVSRWSTD